MSLKEKVMKGLKVAISGVSKFNKALDKAGVLKASPVEMLYGKYNQLQHVNWLLVNQDGKVIAQSSSYSRLLHSIPKFSNGSVLTIVNAHTKKKSGTYWFDGYKTYKIILR